MLWSFYLSFKLPKTCNNFEGQSRSETLGLSVSATILLRYCPCDLFPSFLNTRTLDGFWLRFCRQQNQLANRKTVCWCINGHNLPKPSSLDPEFDGHVCLWFWLFVTFNKQWRNSTENFSAFFSWFKFWISNVIPERINIHPCSLIMSCRRKMLTREGIW